MDLQVIHKVSKAVKKLFNTQWLNDNAGGDQHIGAELIAAEFGFEGRAEELLVLCDLRLQRLTDKAFSDAADEYYREKDKFIGG